MYCWILLLMFFVLIEELFCLPHYYKITFNDRAYNLILLFLGFCYSHLECINPLLKSGFGYFYFRTTHGWLNWPGRNSKRNKTYHPWNKQRPGKRHELDGCFYGIRGNKSRYWVVEPTQQRKVQSNGPTSYHIGKVWLIEYMYVHIL